jgi:recombination protein RecT
MNNNGLAEQKQETGMQRVKNYMLSPEVRERFEDMMGANAIYYLNQVMIVVANSKNLQECEPQSILISAMRAASLRLSVDPGQGQAWIIPYKGKATFQLGYKGVYELAQRTNLYRFINVIDIYEGETLDENRMTGMHVIGGKRSGNKVIARMLYFQLFSGFEKTFVMTVEEIDAHAARYSQSYQQNTSKWHDPIERPKMERKTVLVNGLRRWGRFNQSDADTLDAIEDNTPWQERMMEIPEETTAPVVQVHTEEQNISELYGEPQPPAVTPPAHDEVAQVPAVSYEEACKVWTSDKEPKLYSALPNDKLSIMANAIAGKLLKHGYTTPEVQVAEHKLGAIRAILAHTGS